MRTMAKLSGFDFFRAIGSPKKIVAPMVDQSEAAFRMLTRKYGADLCYTPMYHSRLFVERPSYREQMIDITPEDRPLIVQFCGNDPATLLAAAKMVEDKCDAVDINLGCPQGIAKKGNYGSFLLEQPDLVCRMVEALHQNLNVPVTCKVRILSSEQETLDFCQRLVEAGCQMLVVHGRTRGEKKQFVGPCDWQIIKKIKDSLPIPVIANGGIENMADFDECLKVTGADGVMVSEAILEKPAIFTDNICPSSGIELSQEDLAKEYMTFCEKYPPRGTKVPRAHLFKILFQTFSENIDIRQKMGESVTYEEFYEVLRLLEERGTRTVFGPVNHKGWYRRHRVLLPPEVDGAQPGEPDDTVGALFGA